MKRIMLLIILFYISQCFNSGIVYGQYWEHINPYPTFRYLSGVDFVNIDTGYICGYGGEVYKTINGGNSWAKLDIDYCQSFLSIKFIDQNTGILTSNGGLILRTEDSGESWVLKPVSIPTGLTEVFFVDNLYGWIVGDYYTVLRTEDSGENWERLHHSIMSDIHFSNCEFINQDTGYLCGSSNYNEGRLFRTIDGGENLIQINIPEEIEFIKGMDVIDDQEVWLGAGNQVNPDVALKIYHTMDGGITWDTITLDYFKPGVTSIKFFNDQQGRVLCMDYMYQTNDGGGTWAKTHINERGFFDICWLDDQNFITVGLDGYIFKTENSGNSWTELSSGNRSSLRDISFYNLTEGFIVGYYTLLKTTDLGETWMEIELDPELTGNYSAIEFSDEYNGWIAAWGFLLKTDDAGNVWEKVIPDSQSHYFSDISLFRNSVWVGGDSAKLLRSIDDGNTWIDISIEDEFFSVQQIEVIDTLTAYVSLNYHYYPQYGKLFKTVDGGYNWTQVEYYNEYPNEIYSIDFVNSDTGYISVKDQGLMKTTDGGENWTLIGLIENNNITYIKFFSDDLGIICSYNLLVGVTYNGGQNWETNLIPECHLSTIFVTNFTDIHHGFIVGNNGLIRKFTGNYTNIKEGLTFNSKPCNHILFPNPAKQVIYINPPPIDKTIVLFDKSGQELQRHKYSSGGPLDISKLPEGMYFISVNSSTEKPCILKFIIIE